MFVGERNFSKSWGSRASVSFPFASLPLPPSTFFFCCYTPNFLHELARKRLLPTGWCNTSFPASILGGSIAEFSEHSSRRFLSLVGAYRNAWDITLVSSRDSLWARLEESVQQLFWTKALMVNRRYFGFSTANFYFLSVTFNRHLRGKINCFQNVSKFSSVLASKHLSGVGIKDKTVSIRHQTRHETRKKQYWNSSHEKLWKEKKLRLTFLRLTLFLQLMSRNPHSTQT